MTPTKTPRKKRTFEVHYYEPYCKGCAICVEMCPAEGLKMSLRLGPQGYFLAEVADHEACTGCRFCEVACPDMAVTVIETTEKDS